MKNHFLLAVGFLFLAEAPEAQNWTQQTSTVSSNLSSVFFVDLQTGWAAGENSIVKTTNGGITWVQQTPASSNWTSALYFINKDTGWTAGSFSSGNFSRTTNGGATWLSETNAATSKYPVGMFFASASTGWIVGYGSIPGIGTGGVILKTTDGGTTWNSQTNPDPTLSWLRTVQFIDLNTGWAAGDAGVILKTTNGGTNWVVQQSYNTLTGGGAIRSLRFIDANTGWIAGFGSQVFKTTNGGTSWTAETTSTAASLVALDFPDATHGWAVGPYGGASNIMTTTDGGATWFPQQTGKPDMYAVDFVTPYTGWAVGVNGIIYKYSNPSAPPRFSYVRKSPVWGTGSAVLPDTPVVLEGFITTTYTVTPSLPAGLTLNSSTGIISGTPTAPAAAGNYVITSTNAVGSGKDTLNITVLQTPSNLSYSNTPAIYYAGTAITSNTPTVTGPVTRYSITPALPAGLSLDTLNGIISGTPATVSAAANYTVRAYNNSVSTTATVNIQVVSAPMGLSYSSNPAVYGINVAISPNNPTVSGNTPITYSVTPSLPAGLSLNTGTGVISGTPTVGGPAANYSITASNPYGSASTLLNITVLAAPSGLSYSSNPAQYAVGTAIAANRPSVSGTVSRYSITPALPAGLSLDTNTGVISGSPALPSAAANYTVTASSVAGSTMVQLNIGVLLAPSNLSYSANPAVFPAGTVIVPNVPSIQGTAPFTFSVNPALPSGLSLNPSTGIISGTPSSTAPAANYAVTASNAVGTTAMQLNITVTGSSSIHQNHSRVFALRIPGAPSFSFHAARDAQNARFTIMDARGTRIWENVVGVGQEAGWNGAASNGEKLAAGVYSLQVAFLDGTRNITARRARLFLYTP